MNLIDKYIAEVGKHLPRKGTRGHRSRDPLDAGGYA